MTYMLVLVLAGQGTFGNEFTSQNECMTELRRVEQEIFKDGKGLDIKKLACDPGIVLSETD
jgi:hypothetical protein